MGIHSTPRTIASSRLKRHRPAAATAQNPRAISRHHSAVTTGSKTQRTAKPERRRALKNRTRRELVGSILASQGRRRQCAYATPQRHLAVRFPAGRLQDRGNRLEMLSDRPDVRRRQMGFGPASRPAFERLRGRRERSGPRLPPRSTPPSIAYASNGADAPKPTLFCRPEVGMITSRRACVEHGRGAS